MFYLYKEPHVDGTNGLEGGKKMEGLKRFAILGNISSGKSTVVKNLKKAIEGSVILDEPVSLWRESGFLPAFYGDMKRYAFPFQMFAFATRQSMYKDIDATNASCLIVDAHVYTDRHVFAQNLKDGGLMTDQELEWYNTTFSGWEKIVPESVPTAFIYLKASPQKCFDRKQERIKKEGRTEESAVTLDYLQSLHAYFERVLNSPQCALRNVVVIDADKPEGEVLKLVMDEINKHLKPSDDVC